MDTCFNRTQTYTDPIYVQISSNNGIFWLILTTIIYQRESPHTSWLIELPNDEAIQRHLVRIRLFQRVTTSITNKNQFLLYL